MRLVVFHATSKIRGVDACLTRSRGGMVQFGSGCLQLCVPIFPHCSQLSIQTRSELAGKEHAGTPRRYCLAMSVKQGRIGQVEEVRVGRGDLFKSGDDALAFRLLKSGDDTTAFLVLSDLTDKRPPFFAPEVDQD